MSSSSSAHAFLVFKDAFGVTMSNFSAKDAPAVGASCFSFPPNMESCFSLPGLKKPLLLLLLKSFAAIVSAGGAFGVSLSETISSYDGSSSVKSSTTLLELALTLIVAGVLATAAHDGDDDGAIAFSTVLGGDMDVSISCSPSASFALWTDFLFLWRSLAFSFSSANTSSYTSWETRCLNNAQKTPPGVRLRLPSAVCIPPLLSIF